MIVLFLLFVWYVFLNICCCLVGLRDVYPVKSHLVCMQISFSFLVVDEKKTLNLRVTPLLEVHLHSIAREQHNVAYRLGFEPVLGQDVIVLQQPCQCDLGLRVRKVLAQTDPWTGMEGHKHEGPDLANAFGPPAVRIKDQSILAPQLGHSVGDIRAVGDGNLGRDVVAVGQNILLHTLSEIFTNKGQSRLMPHNLAYFF